MALAALTAGALGCGGPSGPGPDASSVDGAPGRDAGPFDAGDSPDGSPPDAGPAAADLHEYVEDEAVTGGPERGFYRFVSIADETDLSWVAADGGRLVFSYVRLDDYRQRDIPSALLDRVRRGLDAARDAGLKVILRFAYNEGPYPDSEPDAPLTWVLAHIAQIAPLLEQHADVITIVQAGFIGAWGEWHTSTNGLLEEPSDRQTILEALVDVLPVGMFTQIRYPLYKEEMYGAPRTGTTAYDGSYAARIGHHNDCFLSSETDVGTYPSDQVDRLTRYVAADTLFVPFGGETCAPYPARSDCGPARAEFERLHVSYMNEDFHPEIVSTWRRQGCYDELARRMGYRLVVESARFPGELSAGQSGEVQVTIRNEGYAAPYQRRPVQLTFGGNTVDLGRDARWLLPGERTTLRARLTAPEAPGDVELSLAAPDPHTRLAGRAEYALPFANRAFRASAGSMPLGTIRVGGS